MTELTTNLEGHFLISMPGADEGAFHRSVVYMCAHSRDGAMGLVINKPSETLSFAQLLAQLAVLPDEPDAPPLSDKAKAMQVLSGGPVEAGRGFVLHTADFSNGTSTVKMDDDLALTATMDVLRALATGDGPREALFLLGYAGWAPGQLEQELQANSWLAVRANHTILFRTDYAARYDAAMRALGIHPALLSLQAGRA